MSLWLVSKFQNKQFYLEFVNGHSFLVYSEIFELLATGTFSRPMAHITHTRV